VRPGDVGDMARYFVRQAARRKGLPAADLTEEAVRRLESYTFPNNIKVPPASSSLLNPQSAWYLFQNIPYWGYLSLKVSVVSVYRYDRTNCGYLHLKIVELIDVPFSQQSVGANLSCVCCASMFCMEVAY